MKKSKIKELSDEELKAFYIKAKRKKLAALIAAPIGGLAVGFVSGRSIATFLPATAAYCALCGVCGYTTSSNYYNSIEELNERDTTRRFLFEDFKKSKMSKKDIQVYKKVLEKLIEHKNSLCDFYSVLELENDLVLYKVDEPVDVFAKMEENKKEREKLKELIERTDKVIDDYVFLLSSEKEYLESLEIPPVGVNASKYRASAMLIDNDTTFYQKEMKKDDFSKIMKEINDSLKMVDDFFKEQANACKTDDTESERE